MKQFPFSVKARRGPGLKLIRASSTALRTPAPFKLRRKCLPRKTWICRRRVADLTTPRLAEVHLRIEEPDVISSDARIASRFFYLDFRIISLRRLSPLACTHVLSGRKTTVEKSAIMCADNPDTVLTTKWLMPNAIRSAVRIVATLMHSGTSCTECPRIEISSLL